MPVYYFRLPHQRLRSTTIFFGGFQVSSAHNMPCPVCNVPLTMSERQGVEIDYCPQCRGVWLDRGELDKIIERSGRDMAPPPPQAPQAPPPQHGYPQQGYGQQSYGKHGYPKRRKSFLEELFD
jgi:Zn-finger nucleic acid-binding protein